MKRDNKRSLKANINGIIGASGSGKTHLVMRALDQIKPDRLFVWDTKGEFARAGYGRAVHKVSEAIAMMKAAKFKICFQPSGSTADIQKQFDMLCMACFHAKNLVMVGEELSDVTTAANAPAGWRKLTTQGRTEGVTIYGLSQSPAQIDKNFFGNCSTVVCFRLNFEAHIKAMANCLGVDQEKIRQMKPGEFVSRNMANGERREGNAFA